VVLVLGVPLSWLRSSVISIFTDSESAFFPSSYHSLSFSTAFLWYSSNVAAMPVSAVVATPLSTFLSSVLLFSSD